MPASALTSQPRLRLTLWTDDPDLAGRARAAGVDRVGPDLERLDKARRQRGHGTWIRDDRPPCRASARSTSG